LSRREIWIYNARVDRSVGFFHNFFNQACVLNITSFNINPTWSNNISGIDCVSNRLDRFFIHGDFLQKVEMCRSWVGSNLFSHHFPVVLELDKNYPKLGSPFKFNLGWVSEEEFQYMVKVNQLMYDPSRKGNLCEQFVYVMKRVREKMVD